MAERLIIKKFGPIEQVDLDLSKIVVFIGPQSSGKSTIAKVLSIFRSIDTIVAEKKYSESFQEFMISNYFRGKGTYMEYSSNNYSIIYKNEGWQISKTSEFETKIENEKKRIEDLITTIVKDRFKTAPEPEMEQTIKQVYELNWKNAFVLLKKQIYIPAERILTSIISEAGFSFNEVSLPGTLKHFGRHFENSRFWIKELKIDALNVTYKYSEDGVNKGYRVFYDDKHSLSISESSSGIQSSLPLQIVVESLTKTDAGYSFIVEEPELNLFPTAQKAIVNFLIEKSNHRNDLVITTHSPYVLSVLNNLIFAHTVSKKKGINKEKISEIIPENIWIDQTKFRAYYLEKGIARTIFDNSTGLISANELDSLSEDIIGERDILMEIYRGSYEVKN